MPHQPNPYFQPVSGLELPRFAGVPTFMRLPHVTRDHDRIRDVEIGLVGVPWDAGTTNRPGPRHGPRQLRDYSTMIRSGHPVSGINPFALANCADLGDVTINPADIQDSMERITGFYGEVLEHGIVPMTAGGDHLVSLPVLRAVAQDGPVGMIHFDAHTDLFHSYFGGSLYTHGTPFRRAVEEGLLDPRRVIQIGIRGTMYDDEDVRFGRGAGVTIITVDEFFERGVDDVMSQGPRRGWRQTDLLLVRHRLHRSRLCTRNRNARNRRTDLAPGAAGGSRPARGQSDRRRPGRGFAAVRSWRKHRMAGRFDHVRNHVHAGEQCRGPARQ